MIREMRGLAAAGLLAVGLAGCASHPRAPTAALDVAQREGAFLAHNAQAKGMNVLPGLQYQIITSGPQTGRHPTRADDVTVRYEGRFLNGTLFNTSPDNGAGTVVFPLQKLIPGWVAALQLMRPGDIWMIYIPANLAYGAAGKPDAIPPGATLIFKVELVASGPHVEGEVIPPPPPPPPSTH